MTDHEVIVAGGGPTGLMLAAELALGGVDVAVIERRPSNELVGSRAGGIHARTIEVLDQRGVADRFLSEGQTAQAAMFGPTILDMSDFPTRHPYALGIFQNKIERILAGWVAELPVRMLYANAVTGLVDNGESVEVTLADERILRAGWLAGADGGRSLVRKAAGIAFPGVDATRSTLIAEIEFAAEPPAGTVWDDAGVHGIQLLEDGRTYRVITAERELVTGTEPTVADLSAALTRAFGRDFGPHTPTWISRFTDATRQAEHYRAGRVLLAGDAAHIHYPAGGQGLSLGIQDAVNLGWKLAAVVRGQAPESLLDSYDAERHPVGERALKHAMAQGLLQRQDPRTKALVETVVEIAQLDESRKRVAGLISGLDIHYDLGSAQHPLAGRRMPDLAVAPVRGTLSDAETGDRRLFTLLHGARAFLLNLATPGRLDGVAEAWSADGRLQVLDAVYDGPWELPVIGEIPAPDAVLVRPDGYVAWIGERNGTDGLTDALTRWLGPVRSG